VYFDITGKKIDKNDFLKINGRRRYELAKEKLNKLVEIPEEQLRTNSIEDYVNARSENMEKINVVSIDDNLLKRNEIINKKDTKNSDEQKDNIEIVSNDENESKDKKGFFANIKAGIMKFMKEKLGVNIGEQPKELPEGKNDIRISQNDNIENQMDKYKVSIQPVINTLKDKSEEIQKLTKSEVKDKEDDEFAL
jgi:hypothetical protein